jgi:hypothetical protein
LTKYSVIFEEEKFLSKKKEMEGLYVRFKETDHPIWIGTHKYGMVKIRNGMSSASLRKLYTVGDAITSFKTAVAPDVDGSSITLF